MSDLTKPRLARPLLLALVGLAGCALAGGVLASCTGDGDGGAGECAESPGALYERRIAPLLTSDHPNTCGQCHVSGDLDLESFLRPDPCESMACLKSQGLVNLDRPETSVLLAWVERAEPDSALITPQVIAEERAGLLEWIEHEAECGACADAVCPDPPAASCDRGAELPPSYDSTTDPGDCERETLERLFRGTVYDWRGRCSPCHVVEQTRAAPTAPRWLTEIGGCEVAALATQRRILDAGYVDYEDPARSLLLLKPLDEVGGGVQHGGHAKFTPTGDAAYDAFLYWITRTAECAQSE